MDLLCKPILINRLLLTIVRAAKTTTQITRGGYYVAKAVSFRFMTNHYHSLILKPIRQKLAAMTPIKQIGGFIITSSLV